MLISYEDAIQWLKKEYDYKLKLIIEIDFWKYGVFFAKSMSNAFELIIHIKNLK